MEPSTNMEEAFAPFKHPKSFIMSSIKSNLENHQKEYELLKEQKEEELDKMAIVFEEAEEQCREIYEERSRQLMENLQTEIYEELSQIYKKEEQIEREQRFNRFIQERKQKEKEWDQILKAKKSRVIKSEVKPEYQEKMETILADKEGILQNFDTLYNLNPKNTTQFCSKVLSEPTPEELEESEQFVTEMGSKIKQKESDSGIQIILSGFKKQFEEGGGSFIISKKSTSKSQLCTKILTSGFFENLIQFTEHLENTEQWNFDSLYYDDEKKEEFEKWYKKQKAKEYNINEESIMITGMVQGSIQVQWIVVDAAELPNVMRRNAQKKVLKLHPYFQHFELSPEDFDPKGNIQYVDTVKEDVRGGWPYFLPVHCKRYGLMVLGRFDGKNDDWLMMNGNVDEWAVAFHGVKAPASLCNDAKIFNCIMKGIQSGQMLKAGTGQNYKDKIAVNNPSTKVGTGIYCSPHFQECLSYANPIEISDKKYRLILQCRVRPSKIKVCAGCEEFWVINESKDIRPYGVLLIKEQNVKNIKKPEELFGKNFKWADYQKKVDLKASIASTTV